jgi:hypothetical protein
MPTAAKLQSLDPRLQVSFYYRLRTIRGKYLLDALHGAVGRLEVAALDAELSRLVSPEGLRPVAACQGRFCWAARSESGQYRNDRR